MGIYKRPDSPWWWLYVRNAPKGQRKQKTAIAIGTTAEERRDNKLLAEQALAQRMTELAARIHRLPSAKPAIRFNAYADAYERDVLAHQKGAVRATECSKVLRAYFGKFSLETIDQDAVRSFITERLKPHKNKKGREVTRAPRTVNREVDVLKAMLRDAVPKYLDASPIAGMKKLRAETPTRRLLQPEEEQRLLKVCDPVDRALLILGLDTLMRMGDILDLKRADRNGVWLRVRDPKSGAAYDVPLSKRAAKALDQIPGFGEFYFAKFRVAKKPRDWRGSVAKRLKYLCKEAKPPVPFGRAVGGISFHWATRRTGATRLLVKKKQPLSIVQRIGNWRNPDTLLEIYSEAERDDMLAAVGRKA